MLNNKVSKAVRLAIAFGAASTAVFSTNTFANENNEGKKVEVEEVERIQVTGSRINRTELEPTQPITFVNSETINSRGFTNPADAVTDIPGVFSGLSTTTAGGAGNSAGLGQRTISLYGIGSQRTLTLVDGNRFVSSVSPLGGGASGLQVDVNNIPVGLIERVEVVKAGGAAVYGADAVAGVVNYILKDDYEGAEASVNYKSIGDAGADETSVRTLVGGNFLEDKGNIVVALEFNKTDTIAAKDLDSFYYSSRNLTPTADKQLLNADGTVNKGQVMRFMNPRAGILSNSGLVTPGSVAVTNLGLGAWGENKDFWHFDPNGSGNLVPFDAGIPTGDAIWASGGDGLNLRDSSNLQVGTERYNFSTLANYKITDDVKMKIMAVANRSFAEFSGYQASRYSSGIWSPEPSGSLKFSTDNPYLTAESKELLEGYLGGPGEFYMHKAWTDLGVRYNANENLVHMLKLGFEGDFELLDEEWSWNASYQRGRTSISTHSDAFSDHRFFAALDVGVNPDTNQIDCKFNYVDGYDANLRASGFGLTAPDSVLGKVGDCKPLNPFAPASQEAADYMSYNVINKVAIQQDVFQAGVTGGLYELPAGYLSAAFGYERRTEFAQYASSGTGVLTGNTDSSTEGSYVTEDVFGEFYIPVISEDMDIPLVASLSAEMSYRKMDNSRSGSDNVWAVGISYRPLEDLLIKANKSSTVRAPSVSELFAPVREVSDFAADPCDIKNIDKGPNPAVRKANCQAEGVPADFDGIAERASRNGFTGGNSELKNEQATTQNIGILYSPEWLDGFAISADWVKIDITDAIVSFDLEEVMNACYDASDFPNKFCTQFTRGADYQLPVSNAFRTGQVNAAIRNFEAYEYNIRFGRSLSDYPLIGGLFGDESGELTFNLRAINQKKNETSNTGFDFTDETGEVGSPDWRGDLSVNYVLGDFSAFVDFNYTGGGLVNNESTMFNDYLDFDGNPYSKIPSRTLVNIGASYNLTDDITIRGTVDNATDWDAPGAHKLVGRWSWGRIYNLGLNVKF